MKAASSPRKKKVPPSCKVQQFARTNSPCALLKVQVLT